MKEPGAGARIDMLAMEAERQFDLAAQEDRERTSFYIRPRISY
jgi:hypothetical protein